MPLIDLSQEISPRTQVFPTYPTPYFLLWTRREIYGFEAEVLMMAVHTGTHVDAPYHFSPEGVGIDEVRPEKLVGEAVVADLHGVEELELITLERFLKSLSTEVREGDIVLVRTGWDRYVGDSKYVKSYPGLSREVAEYLVDRRVSALGIDTPNPDHPQDSTFPVHNTLLPRNILIIENLANLGSVSGRRIRFIGLPLKLKGLSGSPIRAVAEVP
ncbi:Kynurenine formamidase [archaeon HR01]|nr:Kynurenine formamidase [archaeon HR01]